jgi:hypothetical protein
MSSRSGGTLATSPDTGYGPGVDDALEYAPHESGDSPARRATPAAPMPTQDEDCSGAAVALASEEDTDSTSL